MRLQGHIERCFPQHYAALDSQQIRELTEIGIQRAAQHNIVSERGVCKFIDLMLIFGVEFDEDPAYPWASEILNNPDNYDPVVRIDTLFDTALDELEKRPESHG